jgi:hypothetical protein
MTTTDFNICYDSLNISIKDMLEFYPKGTQGLEDFTDVFNEIIEEGRNFIQTRGGYVVIDKIECIENDIRIDDTYLETGRIISRQMRDAEKAVIFACTAGNGVREKYDRYISEKDPLKAFFTDTLGSLAVEKAMDIIHDSIQTTFSVRGLHCTNRYSPGYCGWSVGEQQKLWKFLPEKYCGISLTDSSLMLPIKSVSGIIGLGKKLRKNPYSCSICDLNNCIYRRKKNL